MATALLSLFMLSAPASAYEAITGPLGLLAYDKAKAYDGYTLFTPHTKVSSWIVDKIQDPGSRKTYLIDMEGNIVHTWKHDHPAFYAELPQSFTPGRTDLARERPPFHEVRQIRHGDFDRHTLRL